jgi:tetratricopeptide (TPR) repeat protein
MDLASLIYHLWKRLEPDLRTPRLIRERTNMADLIHDEHRLAEIEQHLRNTPDSLLFLIEHGQLLERLGHYDEALNAYGEALKRDPVQVEAHQARGQLRFERGYFTEALASWNILLKLQKADESVYLNKVRALLVQKQIRDAGECLAEAQRTYPRSILLHAQRALEYPYGETEKFVACELVLFLCERMDGQPSSTLLCNKGRVLSYLHRFPEARTAFEQAIKFEPSNPETFLFFAQMLQREDQEAEAQEAFTRALDLYEQRASTYPRRAFDLISKGDLLRSLQRFQEALTTYERVLQGDAASARAWFGRGEALFHLHRYAEATAAYQQAVQLSPVYNAVPAAFAFSTDFWLRDEQKLADCERWLGSDLTSAVLLREKASHLVKLKRYAEALQTAELAVSADARSGPAHLEHGRALYGLGRYDEAYQALQQASQLGIAPSYNLDGYGLSAVLDFLKELQQQNTRLQQQPGDWKCALGKADSLWRFGCYEDAREAYRQACQAGQNDVDACLELASHSYYERAEALRLLAIAQQFDDSNYRVYFAWRSSGRSEPARC